MGRPVSKVGSCVTLPPLQRDLAREQRKAPEVSDRPHCDKSGVNFPHVCDHNCLIDPFLFTCTPHELPSCEEGNRNFKKWCVITTYNRRGASSLFKEHLKCERERLMKSASWLTTMFSVVLEFTDSFPNCHRMPHVGLWFAHLKIHYKSCLFL